MSQPDTLNSTITYEAANKTLGHELGIITATNPSVYDYFTEIEDAEIQTKFENDFETHIDFVDSSSIKELLDKIDVQIAIDNSLTFDDRGFSELLGLQRNLRFLDVINKVVTSCVDIDTTDEKQLFIATIFEKFSQMNTCTLDQWADNFDMTVEFITFYKKSLTERITENEWEQKLTQWRALFIEFIASPKARPLIGEKSVERAVSAVSKIPINIADPLIVMARKQDDDVFTETFGSFYGSNRTIQIDPFTIHAHKKLNREITSELLDVAVKGTVFHELIHAISNAHYMKKYLDEFDFEDEETMMEVNSLWPKFWLEGMTEKMANYISGSVATEGELLLAQTPFTDRSGNDMQPDDHELAWRQLYTHNPASVLHSTHSSEIRKIDAASYREYRLLIDAIFIKLDWLAAGLSVEEAQTMAAHAFIETPEDMSTARVDFMSAISKAAHPGFFMKLQHLVAQHGEKLMTNVILSDEFNPHDPHRLPFIATKEYVNYLAQINPEFTQSRLDRMKHLGASDAVIEHIEMDLAYLHRQIGKHAVVSQALRAQRVLLKHEHLLQNETAEEKLVRLIFGDDVPEGLAKRKRQASPEDVTKAKQAISLWEAATLSEPEFTQ